MTAKTRKQPVEQPEVAAQPCLMQLPYRAIVFIKIDGHGTPVFQVAGSPKPACGAEAALKLAHAVHGGACFYCKHALKNDDMTIDHIEPKTIGGSKSIQNLVVSCKPCNAEKARQPIEAFKPAAGREWLEALLIQVEQRLQTITPPSPRPPVPGATADP